jgi:site-specific recombinase XerD
VRSYGEDLKAFLGFCEAAGLSKPDDVTFRHLEFYLGWLQRERGLKASSANRQIHALRTVWKWMVREEITPRNPAADVFLPKAPRKLPNYLSIAEQERGLATLATRTDLVCRRDHARVATAPLTGLRCSELAQLELAHLNLDGGVLRVVEGKGQKDRELAGGAAPGGDPAALPRRGAGAVGQAADRPDHRGHGHELGRA